MNTPQLYSIESTLLITRGSREVEPRDSIDEAMESIGKLQTDSVSVIVNLVQG